MGNRARVDRLAVVAAGVTLTVTVVFGSLVLRGRPLAVAYDLFLFHNGPPAVLLAWLGVLVLRRRPGDRAGRLLLAIAVLSALHVATAGLADARLVAAGHGERARAFADDIRPADLPLDTAVLTCAMNWLWVPAPLLVIALLPVLFPDGRLPSLRWWPVPAGATVGGGLVMLGLAIEAWPTATWTTPETPPVVGVLLTTGALLVIAAAAAGLASLGIRWHRTDPVRRQPFHVVGAAAAVLGIVAVATYPWPHVWIPAILLAWYGLLGTYALAVARYRLHDMEPFLGRAAVAALLSAGIAAVYAVIVIGIGTAIGRPFDDPVLPIVALAAVAMLIEPARHRARRLVDRRLYRAQADRSEVLSRVAARASTSTTAGDVLQEVTALLVRSTGADRAEAWLEGATAPLTAAGASSGDTPLLTEAVTHQGARFGDLRLYARAHADLVGDARELLADVAHALGIVLRNEQLTAQLRDQLDELQASRQRLVDAHERGRHSLERDIHDGAQSRLIALRLRIGALHARYAGRDPDLARELDALAREVDITVRSLRDLARGLAPPLLDQFGLATALRAHARSLAIPVTVTVVDETRFPPQVESAAYFCCLEAIQNAIRHGGAERVAVSIDGDDTLLRFEVRDDGVGFDPSAAHGGSGLTNIADRVAALAGHVEIDASPGAGTRLVGEIPAPPRQASSATAAR